MLNFASTACSFLLQLFLCIYSPWHIQYGTVLSENLSISRAVRVIYKACGGEESSARFKGEPDRVLSLTER